MGKVSYRDWLTSVCVHRHGMAPQQQDWLPLGEPLPAWVNQGIWSVECSHCGEPVIIDPGETFICPGCLNSYQAHRARPVRWPGHAMMREIETILTKRTRNHRSWQPEETLDFLRAENDLHGIKE